MGKSEKLFVSWYTQHTVSSGTVWVSIVDDTYIMYTWLFCLFFLCISCIYAHNKWCITSKNGKVYTDSKLKWCVHKKLIMYRQFIAEFLYIYFESYSCTCLLTFVSVKVSKYWLFKFYLIYSWAGNFALRFDNYTVVTFHPLLLYI